MMSSTVKQNRHNMLQTSYSDGAYPTHSTDFLFVNAKDDTSRTRMKYSNRKKIHYKESHSDKYIKDDLTTSPKQPRHFSGSELDGKHIDSKNESDSEVGSICHKQMMATLAENFRLRQLLKDVTEVNKRWQKYNQDRQDYVQQLLFTIQTLEIELGHQPRNSSIEKVKKHVKLAARHSDSDLLDPSAELSMLRKAHDFCIKENAALHKRNEEIQENFEKLSHHHETLLNKIKDQEDNKLSVEEIQVEKIPSLNAQRSNSDGNHAVFNQSNQHFQSVVNPRKNSKRLQKTRHVAFSMSQEKMPSSSASVSDSTQCPICEMPFRTAEYAGFLRHYEKCLNRTSSETIKHDS